MKLVIEIDKDKNDRLDYLDVITLKEIIRNGKPLHKDFTNGDVIKTIFPKYYQTVLWYLGNTKWWNTPYKEEGAEMKLNEQTKEDIDRAFKALGILEEAIEQGKQKEFNQNREVQFLYCGRKYAIRELSQ